MTNTLSKEQFIPSYNLQEWRQGYESISGEYEYWIEDIVGKIPDELEGTLFRNGPGLLDIHGIPVKHPFDGDGMICGFYFKDGKCYFRNRFVRTEEFVKEQKAGKIIYRGVFGTQKPGGWLNNIFDLKIKNIANTNVIYWGGKLLALWEAAEPYSLDPSTLETIGIDYLDGILESGDSFAAHPWVDPHSKFNNGEPSLVNFSVKPGLSTKINIYELDQKGKLVQNHQHIFPGFAFIHDFVITPNYCIFFQNPVSYNPLPFIFGLAGAGECVDFKQKESTNILVIPRNGGKPQIFKADSGFVFHHANAFELDDEIIIDSICYESLPQVDADKSYKNVEFEKLDPGQLWRFTLSLKNKSVESQLIESRCCEFPSINPEKVGRAYRYLFVGATHNPTGNAPLQAILKVDLHTKERQIYSFAPQGYVSEPIFVPKPNAKAEDDGWVLTLIYDGNNHRSSLIILDGNNLNKKPIAQLNLKHHIPYGLHGNWTSFV